MPFPAAVLLSGHVALRTAFTAIDWHVMAFLLGAFVIGDALERSGLLFTTAHRLLPGARSTDALVFRLLVAAGLGPALLMNDTLAVVGPPWCCYWRANTGCRHGSCC
ncbi:MAG: SLC13 family permease [Thiohalomonadaceae bacterium]